MPILGLQVGALLFWDSWTDAMSEFLLQKGYYRIESIRMQVTTLRVKIWSYCYFRESFCQFSESEVCCHSSAMSAATGSAQVNSDFGATKELSLFV